MMPLLCLTSHKILQPTYVRSEGLNVLGLAFSWPSFLARRLRQSGDDMRRGDEYARRNNAPAGVRLRA